MVGLVTYDVGLIKYISSITVMFCDKMFACIDFFVRDQTRWPNELSVSYLKDRQTSDNNLYFSPPSQTVSIY